MPKIKVNQVFAPKYLVHEIVDQTGNTIKVDNGSSENPLIGFGHPAYGNTQIDAGSAYWLFQQENPKVYTVFVDGIVLKGSTGIKFAAKVATDAELEALLDEEEKIEDTWADYQTEINKIWEQLDENAKGFTKGVITTAKAKPKSGLSQSYFGSGTINANMIKMKKMQMYPSVLSGPVVKAHKVSSAELKAQKVAMQNAKKLEAKERKRLRDAEKRKVDPICPGCGALGTWVRDNETDPPIVTCIECKHVGTSEDFRINARPVKVKFGVADPYDPDDDDDD